jgi:hypothetical protein
MVALCVACECVDILQIVIFPSYFHVTPSVTHHLTRLFAVRAYIHKTPCRRPLDFIYIGNKKIIGRLFLSLLFG